MSKARNILSQVNERRSGIEETLRIMQQILIKEGMKVTIEGSKVTVDPRSGGEPVIKLQLIK